MKKSANSCKRILLLGLISGAFYLSNSTFAQTNDTTAKTAPAFMVVEVKVNDLDTFKKGYMSKIQPTLEPFGGHYIAVRTRVLSLEGAPPAGAAAILEFPSFEKAEQWYHSAAYQEIIGVRQATAVTRIYIVEGVPR